MRKNFNTLRKLLYESANFQDFTESSHISTAKQLWEELIRIDEYKTSEEVKAALGTLTPIIKKVVAYVNSVALQSSDRSFEDQLQSIKTMWRNFQANPKDFKVLQSLLHYVSHYSRYLDTPIDQNTISNFINGFLEWSQTQEVPQELQVDPEVKKPVQKPTQNSGILSYVDSIALGTDASRYNGVPVGNNSGGWATLFGYIKGKGWVEKDPQLSSTDVSFQRASGVSRLGEREYCIILPYVEGVEAVRQGRSGKSSITIVISRNMDLNKFNEYVQGNSNNFALSIWGMVAANAPKNAQWMTYISDSFKMMQERGGFRYLGSFYG